MYRYWGKAKPASEGSASYHLLVYHSLDVAAVGHVLLARHPDLLARFSAALDVDSSRLHRLLVFLLAIHDLGKFSETFQGLQPEFLDRLQGRQLSRFEAMRHDSLGYLIWTERLWPLVQAKGWFGMGGDRRAQRHWRSVFDTCLQVVTGHHGQPPKTTSRAGGSLLLGNFFAESDAEAAAEYLLAAADLLLGSVVQEPIAADPKALGASLKRWSWWLAGFVVLCDWIGSNQDCFPYLPEKLDLASYWQRYALPQAEEALTQAAVLPATVQAFSSIDALFPYVQAATPLQAKVAELTLQSGPQMFILEDVTGAGKTEAALILVQRLMSAGLAQGCYIALPTMATANAMYARMAGSYQRLFSDNQKPSLVLAHGARELVDGFRQSILPIGPQELEHPAGEGTETATAQCSAWLADQRKKALLANFGVGTIDQALLAILYSRHQSLRLFGLLGKVLVVDEVHACDAYVNGLLRTLLAFHAAAGGSVVLLSATLPEQTRLELIDAFCTGAGYEPPELQSRQYPLLTQIGGEGASEHPLATRPEVMRQVEVAWITTEVQAAELVREAVAAGRCVCWIRNTVADALAACSLLSEHVAGDKLHLFHARYAMCDRLAIENRVLSLFGKDSRSEQRAGQVLVATQVVEQSLDLDFDLLISDLAPIDLLLQRAGRLHRHRRDAAGDPLEQGADQRGGARMVVLGPIPAEDVSEDWYKSVFKGAAHVYSDHGQLWLTARLLKERGGFAMPEDARDLIEGVYGEEAQDSVPEALQESHFDAEGKASSHRSLARQNSLDLDEGYVPLMLDWWDDTITPTRLGDPVSNVRLARWENGRVVPWAPGAYGWQLSQVSIRQSMVAGEVAYPESERRAAVEAAKESMPDKGKWSLLVVLEPAEGVWLGRAKDANGREVSIRYDEQSGLAVNENRQEDS